MTISAAHIGEVVGDAIPQIACELRPDVEKALLRAQAQESSERGKSVLTQLIQNAAVAKKESLPLCQDTGSVWVYLEVGQDEQITGDIDGEVNKAVALAYKEARLRASIVNDALFDRSNTTTNTPAFIEIAQRPGSGVTVHVLLKGGGSDNASRTVMLPPGEGKEGVMRTVLETVREKASSACPPLVIGVGVGSTFDKVGSLAKKALLREVGSSSGSSEQDAFEQELLTLVNGTGVGPGGFGGEVTALAVHLNTAASHIASLPVAVNMGCSAMRSKTVEIPGASA